MNLLLNCLIALLKLLYYLSYPIFWLKSKGQRKSIPPIIDPLLKISATDLAEKIRKKQITSEKVCEAYIKRIKEVNGILNAVVEERFDNALKEAKNVDVYLQNTKENCHELKKMKPLLGVPFTVKESCSLADMSLCVGALSRMGIKADNDGEAVQNLRNSGGIPLLVSNTPEICLAWEASNFITGTTNNPYDTTCTSSGSSSGEGALLGAGASLIGVGSDVAGSIRLPAMFNGVFGHKPSPKLISIKGHYPYCSDENFNKYCVIGPLTRYAKDLKLMTAIMAGNKAKEIGLYETIDLSTIRVYFMEESENSWYLPNVEKEIKQIFKTSVNYLKNECNCKIIENYKFNELKDSCEIAGSVLYNIKDIPNLLKGENNQSLPFEIFKSLLGHSKITFNLLLFYTIQYLFSNFISNESNIRKNTHLKETFIEKLGNDGVFLFPTFTTSAFKHNSQIFHLYSISYLMIVNTLELPSTHVPCGNDLNGKPIGIQVIAAPNQDRLCFAVAEELEKCFGGWSPPT